MRKLFGLLVLIPSILSADLSALQVLQSGDPAGGMVIHGRGLRGEGEIIALLDTGVDWDSCWFADPTGTPPPLNTGTPQGGLGWQNVDLTRRKIVAYNFLFSCDQFPSSSQCEDPAAPDAFDNLGHGSLGAGIAAGDRGGDGVSEQGDGIAPLAKLIIQDAAFQPSSACQLPGLGCPPLSVSPFLEQVYRQGARIHSHSWGDRVGAYTSYSAEVDAFVRSHPEFVVLFHAGNAGLAGASTVTSPGTAKNALQVGGTRAQNTDDSIIWGQSSRGPTFDGRIKPDIVAPSVIVGPYTDGRSGTGDCQSGVSIGTSWSAPIAAGAVALVRQYFRQGYHPSGKAHPSSGLVPSAALLRAMMIASARPVPYVQQADGSTTAARPTPSNEQGFGLPALEDVLYFEGDAVRLRVEDVGDSAGLAAGEERVFTVKTGSGKPLQATLVWNDAAGPGLVNDLDLEVTSPSGALHRGNEGATGGAADRANNAEKVAIEGAQEGTWTVRLRAARLGAGPRQGFALVITGAIEQETPARRRPVRRGLASGSAALRVSF